MSSKSLVYVLLPFGLLVTSWSAAARQAPDDRGPVLASETDQRGPVSDVVVVQPVVTSMNAVGVGRNALAAPPPPLNVTTYAGSAGSPGSADGPLGVARFFGPTGVAADRSGVLYVTDRGNHTIRAISPAGVVTTVAGLAGTSGSANGVGGAARFNLPNGVAVDSAGVLYVSDLNNHTIRRIGPGGAVTTLAGLAGSPGAVDGVGSAARFNLPAGIAIDSSGNLYVSEVGNKTIRRVTPAGVVSTVAGLAGVAGTVDGQGSSARFSYPLPVATDGLGNIWVGDSVNGYTVRRITPDGTVTTIAGTPGVPGSSDGAGSGARFSTLDGLAVDSSGNVFVVDNGNLTVRELTSVNVVTTVAGLAGSAGTADGTGSAARFRGPSGAAFDCDGTLYVADRDNHTVRRAVAAGPVGCPGASDTLTVVLGLKSANGVLAFNQGHVPTNSLEYRWAVYIDSDNNASTGDSRGYDVELSLSHFKPPSGAPYSTGILEGTQQNTWLLSRTGGVYGHALTVSLGAGGSSLVMQGLRSWSELANVSTGNRFLAETFYYSPGGSVSDSTTAGAIPGVVSDSEGDVPYGFVDITSAGVSGALVPPQITSFTASPSSILSGQSSTLAWSSTGGTGATLRPINGDTLGVSPSGSLQVSPTQTTTYTLTVTGPGGSANATATVTVQPSCSLTCAASVPAAASPGLSVAFSGSAAGCTGTTYSWSFGDGATSTQANPSHVYAAPGGYTWTFSASASGATTCTRSGSITVGSLLAIQSISPISGPTAGGTAVTITGTGFQSGATVRLGGVPATGIAVVSGTTITAVTPPHGAGVVDVDVVNPNGVASTLGHGFSFVASPDQLTVQKVTEYSGPTFGGTFVTVTGTGFQAGASVEFGGSLGTQASVQSPTTIYVKTPAHKAERVAVKVASGGASATLTNGYRFSDVPVSIISASPDSGKVGDTLSIVGTGFGSGTTVTFKGVAATSVAVQSNNTVIKCVVPQGSGIVPVVVAVPGSGSATWSFFYLPNSTTAASLTSVTPSAGQSGGGTGVTITGMGFQSGASVFFGTSQATNVRVLSSTTITANVPSLSSSQMELAALTGEPQPTNVFVINPDSSGAGGGSAYTYTPPGGGCLTAGVTQCLSGNRFTVQVAWKNPYDGGSIGVGHPIQLTSDTGSFWFFSDQNTELMVKVLDGSTVNGYFWVFYGALSDVEYTLTVTDTASGVVKSYYNPPRNLGSVADTRAFFVGNRPAEAEVEADAGPSISPKLLERTETRLRAEATERAEAIAALATTCVPNDLAHCLSGGRFRVSATWRNPYDGGSTGAAHAVQLTADTGYFWFFADSNVELIVKVLDGRGANGHFWVFYGALSDVEYTVTVTDTQTGVVKTYFNPPHHLGSVADTAAF